MAFADAYLRAGDKARANSMVQGLATASARAGEMVLQGKAGGVGINDSRSAFSELLVVLSAELHRLRNERLPVALSQVARYVSPQNTTASVMLGLMLSRRDRVDDAIAALRSVPPSDPMRP